MAMISKEVTGSAEAMKLVRNGKDAPKTAMGGTARTSFTGSSDTRAAGAPGPGIGMKPVEGYINQGPVMMDISNQPIGGIGIGGPASISVGSSRVTVSNENITGGMGGRFIAESKGKF
jgi:hypothetical protein